MATIDLKTFNKRIIALLLILLLLPIGLFINVSSTQAGRVTIVIDPGHGGSDSGAVGPTGLQEKRVNLNIALKLKSYLSAAGVRVIMTRSTDKYVSLSRRASIANNANANRFIAIHHNSVANRSVNGTETYAKRGAGSTARDLGRKAQSSLVDNLGLANRGFKYADFYVIKYTRMPSILTEASFISNRAEESRLRTDSWLRREASAIYNGIRRHMRLSSRKDALALMGTNAPDNNLYFPNVIDKNGIWNSYISVRNVSYSNKNISIKLLSTSGVLIKRKTVGLGANALYRFNPRKIRGSNFDGAVLVSASGNSLVGYLSQIKPENTSLGLSQAAEPSTTLSFPRVTDTGGFFRSIVSVQNTSTTATNDIVAYFYNNSGTLLRTKNMHLAPLQNYDFSPRALYRHDFNGMIKITSASQFTALLYQTDAYRRSLALMPGQQNKQYLSFPYVKDAGTLYRSNIVLSNTSNAQDQYAIIFKDFSGITKKQRTVVIPANRSYSFNPRSTVGSDFYGMVSITGQQPSGSARLFMVNRSNNAVGLVEPQSPLKVNYYANINDNVSWVTLFSVRNTDGSTHNFYYRLYSRSGSLYRSYQKGLRAYSGINYSTWNLLSGQFNGPVTVSSTDSVFTTNIVQTN